jgi:hypothetical protein
MHAAEVMLTQSLRIPEAGCSERDSGLIHATELAAPTADFRGRRAEAFSKADGTSETGPTPQKVQGERAPDNSNHAKVTYVSRKQKMKRGVQTRVWDPATSVAGRRLIRVKAAGHTLLLFWKQHLKETCS